jgi:cAMP-dependent protein kinase regulator
LDSYEKSQLADALKIQRFNSGECIIKEGDAGNTFYILEEGDVFATKIISKGIV